MTLLPKWMYKQSQEVQPPTSPSDNVYVPPLGAPAVPPKDSEIYTQLAEVSAFEKTRFGQVVLKQAKGLESVIKDENVRLQAGIAQALTVHGFKPSDLDDAFKEMEQKLRDEAESIDTTHCGVADHEVSYRQQKVNELQTKLDQARAQVKDLEEQVKVITTELNEWVDKLTKSKNELESATKRREIEIDRERAKVLALVVR